ncbi:uncharacterized protein LOC119726417 [Patiria miniata]|uniref:Fibrinogen C-terminal domain-containing protein n=1 Tax=Patiria miniata TaxID=46514 RepID=A0A913ZRH3_PATMI|nr:uncharacterized protein LOC119726417 [Patiria miniata]
MDERCKSFNFNDCNKKCELNFATRREHPKDFNATQGSVYFDADEDTPLYSLDDSSFSYYQSCKRFLDAGYRSSGIYTIYPEGFGNCGLRVYCDMETDGGGWIVFQRRQDGSVDFWRNWTEYQSGFGDLPSEFWLGNDNLVTLTSDDSQGTWELRVDLGDWENKTVWAKYTDFKLSPGEYRLNYDFYDISSTAGDSLAESKGFPFTTKDKDNDVYDRNCAYIHKGAWWFAKSVIAGLRCNSFAAQQYAFYNAENRALERFVYVDKSVRSPVICGRECSMDDRCKSFNYNDCSEKCELNLATRREHPEDFNATQGSVYFDADEDTPLYSLADHSFSYYQSCKRLLDAGYRSSGIYTIYPEGFGNGGLRVYCDMETDGGGWIVFQRRQDGSVDFWRNWDEYQSGFGNMSGEFWLGNDNLVTLTSDNSQGTWELRVDLGDWEDNTVWAKYTDFKLSPGEYRLNYDFYDISSTAGDSMRISKGLPFSTKDKDNDIWERNCADIHKGAWWFNACMSCHLNGIYYPEQIPGNDWGIYWYRWKYTTEYSLKKCSMKIREI